MDDPLIIFRGSSFFQFSDIHKIQKKTFPVRFMTNKNLFNLPRSKILTKIRHLQNLFLQAISITSIAIFLETQDLRDFQRPANSLGFFVTLFNFSSRSFPCNDFSNVEPETRYRLPYRLRSLYQNINSLSDALSKI